MVYHISIIMKSIYPQKLYQFNRITKKMMMNKKKHYHTNNTYLHNKKSKKKQIPIYYWKLNIILISTSKRKFNCIV